MQILDVTNINAALCIDGPDFLEVPIDDNLHILEEPAPPWNKGKKGLQTAWNKGLRGVVKLSEETRKKQSEAQLKRDKSSWSRGHIPWNKGISHSEETKKKISQKHKGRPSHWRGKKQPKAAVEKMKQNLPDRKGAANARAREYEVTFEDGRQIIIKSLETWARENGYAPTSLRNLYNGSGRTKHKDIIGLRPIEK